MEVTDSVRNDLVIAMKAGDIGPRVPSIMELADETGLSAATVKRALRLLHDEGLIYAVPGRGTFVRK